MSTRQTSIDVLGWIGWKGWVVITCQNRLNEVVPNLAKPGCGLQAGDMGQGQVEYSWQAHSPVELDCKPTLPAPHSKCMLL